MEQISNPVLKYYGSKFRIAKWVIEHFPKHKHYVEPFGGGASVLLQKPLSPIETYNDLDADVVNFFRVLRAMPDKVVRQIELTPWARDEFKTCLENTKKKIESARRLYFRLWMSHHAGTHCEKSSSFRRRKERRPPAVDVRLPILYATAKRLRLVQIENRDALKLITEMDSPDTLFYLDPPYPANTRTDKKRYALELNQEEQHRQLANIILQLKGLVVLSGYRCELYEELFERRGWQRVDKTTMVNGGASRIESLWLSPKTNKALLDLQRKNACDCR